MPFRYPLIAGLMLLIAVSCKNPNSVQPLQVSPNGRYLEKAGGTPFYWIGDTGWALFQQLTREEGEAYLDNRRAKGFTLIQAVLFWYPHGGDLPPGPLNEENAYGHRPFYGDENNPETGRPLVREGGAPGKPDDYWDHVDYLVEAARRKGLYLVLLPCWGNAFVNNRMPGSRIVFDEASARAYGRFLGERYRDEPHIIWCLGGDVDPVNFGDRDQRAVYRAMAEGIGRGASGNPSLQWNEAHTDWNQTLMTFHAVRAPKWSGPGAEGGSSSLWFHEDPWLDFNMMETFSWLDKLYPYVSEDYAKQPVKPTVLGEGAYEDGKYGHDCGWLTPLKVRRQGFHAFFAGGAGYTYGHWALWPFRGENCGKTWQTALDAPGGENISSVFKDFLVEQDIYALEPDQSVIDFEGTGGETMPCAMVDSDRRKILVYFPERRAVTLLMDKAPAASQWRFKWFDPRNGGEVNIEENVDKKHLPPEGWEDAVLIVEK